jgi:hypothetical protein
MIHREEYTIANDFMACLAFYVATLNVNSMTNRSGERIDLPGKSNTTGILL